MNSLMMVVWALALAVIGIVAYLWKEPSRAKLVRIEQPLVPLDDLPKPAISIEQILASAAGAKAMMSVPRTYKDRAIWRRAEALAPEILDAGYLDLPGGEGAYRIIVERKSDSQDALVVALAYHLMAKHVESLKVEIPADMLDALESEGYLDNATPEERAIIRSWSKDQ